MQEELLVSRSRKRKQIEEVDYDFLLQKKTKIQTDVSTLQLDALTTLSNLEEHQETIIDINPVSVIEHTPTETDKNPTLSHSAHVLHQNSIFTPLTIQHTPSKAKPAYFEHDREIDTEIDTEIDSLISSFNEIDVTAHSLREQMTNHCDRFFESRLINESDAVFFEDRDKPLIDHLKR